MVNSCIKQFIIWKEYKHTLQVSLCARRNNEHDKRRPALLCPAAQLHTFLLTIYTRYYTILVCFYSFVNVFEFQQRPANSTQARNRCWWGQMQAITTKRAKIANGGYKSSHPAYLLMWTNFLKGYLFIWLHKVIKAKSLSIRSLLLMKLLESSLSLGLWIGSKVTHCQFIHNL